MWSNDSQTTELNWFPLICGDSPFWDSNLTWNTDTPEFTSCFESTFLIWIPSAILFILSPFEFRNAYRNQKRPNILTIIHIMKQIINLVTIIMAIIKLACVVMFFKTSNHEFVIATVLGASIELLNLLIVMVLTLYLWYKGVLVSNALPIFWFFQSIIFAVLSYSSGVESLLTIETYGKLYGSAVYISTILSPLQLALTSFMEHPSPFQRLENASLNKDNCPANRNSFFSFITFSWAYRMIRKGELTLETVETLCPDMKSVNVARKFNHVFLPKPSLETPLPYSSEVEVGFERPSLHRKKRSLILSLIRTTWKPFLIGAILELIFICLPYLQTLFLQKMINFIQTNEIMWHGFVYAVAFWIANLSVMTMDCLAMYFCMVGSVQVKATLIAAVYRKILVLSNPAKTKYTAGEIINLMSIDCQELFEFTSYIYNFFGVPLRIAFTMTYLWFYLGYSSLTGLVIFAILSPISYLIGRKLDKLQEQVMLAKDQRLKQMSEIFNGIKVLKLYAWEKPFMNKVLETRNKELSLLRTSCFVDSFFAFLWIVAPFLTCAACFATYILSDKNNVLDPQTAFVTLNLFNLLRYPMGILPDLMTRFVKCGVSLKRLRTFLFCDEIDTGLIGNHPDDGHSITLKNASFMWNNVGEPIIKELNIEVPKKSLIAIVGPVGSGKSSILSAILGEMQKTSGDIHRTGTLAYVPQQAWIQNATLKKNITFRKALSPKFYDDVVEACALKPDFEILVGGDSTEIGEKGINLSGGQKQRVSLARAVYQDADIYLLDDPLSAVDANVAAHLFDKVIGPKGMLKNKTRLLSTHNIAYLSEVDHILVLSEGQVVEQGSYQTLMSDKGKFAEFLNQHMSPETVAKTETEKIKKITFDRQTSVLSHFSQIENEENHEGQLIEDETVQYGKVKWHVYKSYILKIGIPLFCLVFFWNMLSAGLETGAGMWLSHFSDVLDRKDQLEGLYVYIGLIGGQSIVIYFCYIFLFVGTVNAARVLHSDLLNSVLKSPLSFFDTTPTGRILNRFSKDIESVDSEIPWSLGNLLNLFCWLPFLVGVIAYTSYFILPFLLVALIIYGFILKLYVLTSNQFRRLDSVSRSPIFANYTETIQGGASIRAYKAQQFFINRSHHRVDENHKCYYNRILCNRWLDTNLGILASLILLTTAFVAVFERESIGAGILGLALTYCIELSGGLNFLVKIGAMFESQVVAVERIQEYSALKPEGEWEIETTKPPIDWPQKGAIEVIDYTTVYREGLEPCLKDVNLKIEPGVKLGVVGRTGAGKSSFILSLFRILEATKGRILIDDIDISVIGTHNLRSKLTVIPQDPVLFAGTLRLNLDPWDEHTDEEIWTSLERSHLKDYVSTLTGGLTYPINEGGENLSAGQRQLACLSRALLRKTKILVLDEATASVDLDTDNLIQETVREAFSDCTVVIIAHRLHTIMKCDKIICFSQGSIIEQGSPDELLEDKKTHFYSMAKDAGLIKNTDLKS